MHRHTRLFFLIFLLGSFCAMGQGTISGKSTVTAGTSSTYTLVDDVIYASPNWQTTSGYVSSSSRTGVGPFTYKATIVFDGPSGVNTVSFFTGATLLSTMNVTVNCPAVGQPNAVFVFAYGCGSTTVTTTTTPPIGETWYWQNSSSGTNTGTPSNVGYTLLAGGTYYLRSKNSSVNCWGTAQSFTVTVNPLPGAPVSSGSLVCSSGFLTATPGANANSVNWYTTATGGTPTTGLNSPTVTTTTIFYITSLNTTTGCQTANRTTVTISVNPQPSVPILGTGSLCGGGSGTASPGANGNQVRWYAAASGGSPLSSSNNSPSISVSTIFYVSTYNTTTTCESVRTAFTVNVDPVPTVTVSGSGTLTYGGGTVLSTYAAGYAYQWKLNGSNIPGGNFQSYSPTLAGNFTVGVKKTASSSECTSGVVTVATGSQPAPINMVSVTSIMKEGVASNASLYNLTQQDLAQSISYQDGIGRTFQTVDVGLSGYQTDIISMAGFGKDGLADTVVFLPYVTSTKDGRFRPNALRTNGNQYVGSEQYQFYQGTVAVAQDAFPFARVVRKASPDARVLQTGAPGSDWQPGNGHMAVNQVAFANNTTLPLPIYWKTDGTTSGSYSANQVAVGVATDENGNQVRTYTNLLGQTILKQVQESASNWLSTYYVYDQFGRLKFQVPPKAVQAIGSSLWDLNNNTATDELVYKYWYDSLGRIKEKKVPGSGKECIVYDPLGRAVLTQDANLRATSQWRFVKYDQYGRVVCTGLYTTTSTRKQLQDTFNALDYTSQPYFETLVAGGFLQGYTNSVFPTANLTLLAVNYYDTYDFDQNGTDDFIYNATHIATGLPSASAINTGNMLRGLPTGSARLVLGTTTWLKSALFYDSYDRVVQTQGYNHKNTTTPSISSIVYADLAGHVANTKLTHQGPATVTTVEQRYGYDANWRTTAIYHKTNGGTEYQVAGYTYNALGQLVDKKLHVVNGTPLQSVDLRYHIRGWLSSINNAQLANDSGITNDDPIGPADLFGMELAYNTGAGTGNAPKFNGNLSAVKWKGPGVGAGLAEQRSYNYTYDKSERLLTSSFTAHNGTAWAKEANTLNEVFAYDANGNLNTLQRNQNLRGLSGTTVTSTAQAMDQLSYTYATNTNQLQKVEDTGNTGGFSNGANGTVEYTYNTDGSANKDDNKGISGITYNVLGKPQQINYTNGNTVVYTYDAAGAKLTMASTVAGVTTTTDYVGGFVYTNNALSFFSSPEGRVVKNGSSFEYQYAIADHQGNTRLIFTSATPDNTPFNATFEGDATDWTPTFTNVNSSKIGPGGSAANSGTKVIRMDASYKVGPTRSVHVYPGDKIDMEVWEYHEANSGYGTSSTAIGTLITAVANSIGGVNGGAGEAGLKYSGVNTAFVNFGTGGNQGDGRPAAYLNFILFDRDYKVLDAGWQLAPAATFTKQMISFQTKNIAIEGYLVAWLSYDDDNNWVYFDDFKITHTKNNVVQYNEYYAHGLPTANSWTRENAKENNFLGNGGTEFNATTALYDLDFRNFDPVLGRMHGVDPMADKYSSLTPYNYSFNMPNMVVDVNGADPADNGGRDPANYWFEESMQRRAAQGRGEPQSNTYVFNSLYRGGDMLAMFRTIGGWTPTSGSLSSAAFDRADEAIASYALENSINDFLNSALYHSDFGGAWNQGQVIMFSSKNQAIMAGLKYLQDNDGWGYIGGKDATLERVKPEGTVNRNGIFVDAAIADKYDKAIAYLSQSSKGARTISYLQNNAIGLQVVGLTAGSAFIYKAGVIAWTTFEGLSVDKGYQSPSMVLMHEFKHAYLFYHFGVETYLRRSNRENSVWQDANEGYATRSSNRVARQLGEAVRTHYPGTGREFMRSVISPVPSQSRQDRFDYNVLKSTPFNSYQKAVYDLLYGY